MQPNNKQTLSIKERLITAFIFMVVLILGIYFLSNSFDFLTNSSNPYNVIFNAYALLYVLNQYITEPYFTKPIDVIAKTISIFLILLALDDKNSFMCFWWLFSLNVTLFISSLLIIFLQQFNQSQKVQNIIYKITTFIAKPKIIGSTLYLLALFSYFYSNTIAFTTLFGFWILLVFQTPNPIEKFAIWLISLLRYSQSRQIEKKPIGEAIGYDNPFLYKVEVDYLKHQNTNLSKGTLVYLELENNIGMVGIIFNEKYLLNKRWLSVYVLKDDNNEPLKINLATSKFIDDTNTIFSKSNQVFILDIEALEQSEKDKINKNYLYKNKENFIGYISKESNINKIKFHLLLDEANENHSLIGEGTILFSNIFQKETLFQILDGITTEEKLENKDIYGYTVAIAKKLGEYQQERKQLETVKWLPEIYTPVFLFDAETLDLTTSSDIGRLPNTKYGIEIKDYNALVTHNTAILGILGIGKSCLTFELIQKVVNNTETKVICIDITNQYEIALKKYGIGEFFQYSKEEESIKYLVNHYDKIHKDKDDGGNYNLFEKYINTSINEFVESDCKLMIINPNKYSISRQSGDIKKKKDEKENWIEEASFREATIAEITRVISEASLEICQGKGISEQSRLLLIYEEAHSLIPEWNSTANEGDKNASNGTAKVILQGRKYGLGSFVVTQRTANISKSILNQCNTIFALRVFDDTGKQFLENYIGSDYANTLPSLEERHAIVVGKALKLRQPVIIRLNDMEDIIEKVDESSE